MKQMWLLNPVLRASLLVVKPCSEDQPAGLMLGKGVLLHPDDLNLIQIRSPKNLKIPMLKKKTDREILLDL